MASVTSGKSWVHGAKTGWARASEHNIALIAAGVAFYWFLAMIPLIAAAVLTYGLVAQPETIASHMDAIARMLPGEAAALVQDQMQAAIQGSDQSQGIGLAVSLGLALFGARNGAGSLMLALNVAYECKDARSFVQRNLVALAITAACAIGALLAAGAMALLGLLGNWLWDNIVVAQLLSVLTYVVLGAFLALAAGLLYRFGPACGTGPLRWWAMGPIAAAVGIGLLTLGFGIYVTNFGNYNATYGSLGAVVVLLTWLWLSAYMLLLGAELDAATRA